MEEKKKKSKPEKKNAAKDDGECFFPPKITREPANKQMRIGEKLVVQIEAQGMPAPTYQWFHKGKKISGAISDRYVIPKTRNEHGGQYSCEAKNFMGSVMSKTAAVSFFRQKSFDLLIEPAELECLEGTECVFTIKSPELKKLEDYKFQWQLNGKIIPGATQVKLKFSLLKGFHSGEYTLTITKNGETKVSNVGKLVVKEKKLMSEHLDADDLDSGFYNPSEFSKEIVVEIKSNTKLKKNLDTIIPAQIKKKTA